MGGGEPLERAWFRLAESFSHRRLACMLCNSEELASFTLRHDPAPPPVVVIPNGAVVPSGMVI